MLRGVRRWYRRFFPRLHEPWIDDPPPREPLDDRYAAAYASALGPSESADVFVIARYEEGRRWRALLDRAGVDGGPVLDVGSGSGAVGLAVSAGGRAVVSTDVLWNETARRAHRAAGAKYRHVIADASALPFRDGVFSAVLCLETIEHFPNRDASGAEVSRTLRDGGLLLVITPPRLRFLFRGDPHFAIRGLLFFPPALQRAIAARRGFAGPHHFVERIYTSVAQIAGVFPRCRIERVLSRSRMPKRWFWDAVVLRKG
ncbi:MAG TPA: class I SAM-dependent methyltransferase [Thermoanaerobaculia bacterium]|jgi:SAM-dependent methyltransferase